jgi:hypothetical protein
MGLIGSTCTALPRRRHVRTDRPPCGTTLPPHTNPSSRRSRTGSTPPACFARKRRRSVGALTRSIRSKIWKQFTVFPFRALNQILSTRASTTSFQRACNELATSFERASTTSFDTNFNNRPISVYRFQRRALTLCPQFCMGIQPGACFPHRPLTLCPQLRMGILIQAIYRNWPIAPPYPVRHPPCRVLPPPPG